MTENKVTIRMDQTKLKEQLKRIMKIYVSCDSSRETISDKSDEYGKPSPEAESFYSDINNELRNVRLRHQWITDRMNRIIQINESGIGKRDKTTGVISIDVPESVDKKGISGFDAWGQGVLDSKTLMKYTEENYTPEQYEALLARMKRYQTDPSYAAAVFDEIGPARLLDIPLHILSRSPYGSTDKNPGKDIASVLGHLLATRSQSWDETEAKNYADRLTHYAEEEGKYARVQSLNAMLSASREQDVDGDGGNETVGLDYNDTFLLELAKKLENFKSKGAVDDRYGVHPKASELEGVVHAMTGNLDAAEQWLTVHTSDGKVDTEKTAERTQSLIKKATVNGWVVPGTWSDQWEEDWLMLGAEHAVRGMEDSGGGAQHAAITAAVLNTIGENAEHMSTSADSTAVVIDPYMTLTEKGRNAASIALARYPYAVQTAASSDGDNSDGWVTQVSGNSWARGQNSEGMNYQPVIHQNALRNLLGEIGQDDVAIARYTSMQESFNKLQLQDAAGKDGSVLMNVLDDQAALRGFTSGSIVRQTRLNEGDADARVGAFAEVTGMAINAIPLPQAKAGGAALKGVSTFAMNFGKSAASKGASSGIAELFGDSNGTEKVKENGRQANIEFQTLSTLQNVYTQEERKRIYQDNVGTSISSIISPDGELKVNPNDVHPTEKARLSSDQRKALKHLMDELPQDADPDGSNPAKKAHSGVADFKENRNRAYDGGYDAALG